ncbi:MAG: flagellum-specific ATP synthase FliI, partial [Nitrospirae bacterium]|nr:flagellum-specific ATP synthase FliI [Nitrospirota bacterium]
MQPIDLSTYIKAAEQSEPMRVYGRITEITGIMIKATGLKASVGEACRIYSDTQMPIDAEIVGFKDSKALLMATGDISWIKPDSRILSLGKKGSIRVGEGL